MRGLSPLTDKIKEVFATEKMDRIEAAEAAEAGFRHPLIEAAEAGFRRQLTDLEDAKARYTTTSTESTAKLYDAYTELMKTSVWLNPNASTTTTANTGFSFAPRPHTVPLEDYQDLLVLLTYLLIEHHDGQFELPDSVANDLENWRVLVRDVGKRGRNPRRRYVAVPPEVSIEGEEEAEAEEGEGVAAPLGWVTLDDDNSSGVTGTFKTTGTAVSSGGDFTRVVWDEYGNFTPVE